MSQHISLQFFFVCTCLILVKILFGGGGRERESNQQSTYVCIPFVSENLGYLIFNLICKMQPAAMFKVLKETPPIPENLSAEGKDFLRCCFRRNPADRASASMLLEHRFVRNSHPPDVLSCAVSLRALKLTVNYFSTSYIILLASFSFQFMVVYATICLTGWYKISKRMLEL